VNPPEISPFERLDLERVRTRPGTKWQRTPGALAAWVADMDIAPAGIIRQRLFELIGRGDLGYPAWPKNHLGAGHSSPGRDAFVQWAESRYGWKISDTGHLAEFCDVVQAIEVMLHLCTEPGDGVLLHTPAYPPMFAAIAAAGCELIEIPLLPGSVVSSDAVWESDLTHLETVLDGPAGAKAKVLLLCHPHNPTGKVFRPEELTRLGEIAERHDLVIISDEIHADLEHVGARHRVMASMSEQIAARTVTIHSASKAFNLAGLRYALAHIGPAWLRDRLSALPSHLFGAPNIAGVTAAVAAWTEPEALLWLEQVRTHFAAQRHLLGDLLAEHLPEVVYHVPEATYLGWLDVRALGLGDDPSEFWRSPDRGDHRVDLSPGPDFGRDGYVRLNFATSSAILTEIVTAMGRSARSVG
jgi:cysteine-S-conjugate beta-lyase